MFGDMFEGAKPIQMGLMAALGYFLGPAVDSSGLSMAAYQNVPVYKNFVDKMYTAVAATSDSANNPWVNGGGSGVMKLLGGMLAAKGGYDSYEAGKIKPKDMNVVFPLALGAILDPPNSRSSGMGQTGASSGMGAAGYSSGPGGAGWV